uniref:Uncharacterized protein n=1 Tax=Parascaris univalens TaxID=6257 RepID=A0A915A6G6_PARUN
MIRGVRSIRYQNSNPNLCTTVQSSFWRSDITEKVREWGRRENLYRQKGRISTQSLKLKPQISKACFCVNSGVMRRLSQGVDLSTSSTTSKNCSLLSNTSTEILSGVI